MSANPKWGKKFECFSCECKFYDLNKKKAVCPKCGADQADKGTPEEILEEVEEEPVAEEVAAPVEPGEEAVANSPDDLPEMEEELGYDETDEGDDEEPDQ
jgi:hypothetical protein